MYLISDLTDTTWRSQERGGELKTEKMPSTDDKRREGWHAYEE